MSSSPPFELNIPGNAEAKAYVAELSSRGHAALASKRPRETGNQSSPDHVVELPVDPGPERSRVENVMQFEHSAGEIERKRKQAAGYMDSVVANYRASVPVMEERARLQSGLPKETPTKLPPTTQDADRLVQALERLAASGARTVKVRDLLALLRGGELPAPKTRRRRVA